jgi:hypothetical protein
MNALVEHKPQKASLVAGNAARAIVPTDFDGCWRLANAVCAAGMAPKGLDTPEKATVAIMHGLEVGLTPMAALQSIAVVNGRPTIWGDGALALVRASGLCEGVHETVDGSGDGMVATCAIKRKGERAEIVRSFSVAQAKKAGLWGKAGPWQQYPDRMLTMRARAFALRDGFADVLRGLGIAEEVSDYHAGGITDTGAAKRLVAPPPPDEEPVAVKAAERKGPPDPDAQGDLLGRADAWGRNLQDADDVEAYRDEFGQELDALSDEDRQRLEAIMDRHIQRVGGGA